MIEESDEFQYPSMFDPGTLYEYGIIGGDGDFKSLHFFRFHDMEEAYQKLEDLSQSIRLKFNEEVVFSIVPDA